MNQPDPKKPSPQNPDSPEPHFDQDPDHSMKEEQPMGWDQAPVGEDQPDPHRQPRQMGKGGTPDAGSDRGEHRKPAAP